MIVGTWDTGVERYAPPFGMLSDGSGMQEGCIDDTCVMGSIHSESLLESQPHPGAGLTVALLCGFAPMNPSVVAATAYKWPPQDGLSIMLKVRSLTANLVARAARLGI